MFQCRTIFDGIKFAILNNYCLMLSTVLTLRVAVCSGATPHLGAALPETLNSVGIMFTFLSGGFLLNFHPLGALPVGMCPTRFPLFLTKNVEVGSVPKAYSLSPTDRRLPARLSRKR